jgi:hypothetical protein
VLIIVSVNAVNQLKFFAAFFNARKGMLFENKPVAGGA